VLEREVPAKSKPGAAISKCNEFPEQISLPSGQKLVPFKIIVV